MVALEYGVVFVVATFHFSVLGFCTSVRIGCHRPSLSMAARPSVDVEEWQDPRLSADIENGRLAIHGSMDGQDPLLALNRSDFSSTTPKRARPGTRPTLVPSRNSERADVACISPKRRRAEGALGYSHSQPLSTLCHIRTISGIHHQHLMKR